MARITAEIVERPSPTRIGVWAGFVVPQSAVASIARGLAETRRRIPVVVSLGNVSYRTSLTRQAGQWEFVASLEFRRRTGTHLGDVVTVDIVLDAGERQVELPADLATALIEAGLEERFRSKPYSHQREYLLWVEDAKRPETRARRIRTVVEREAGGTGPYDVSATS